MSAIALNLDTQAIAGESPAIAATALAKSIDERPILEDLNFTFAPGRFVALLGANGAGKSTLLKILSTLTPPTSGELRLFGKPLGSETAKLRGLIGLISHQSMLYRDLSARQNLEFFGRLYAIPDPRGTAERLLVAVGLIDRADDAVKALSRGMTQRVAIARALVHNPDLLLADEPFDGLDAPSTAVLEKLLLDLQQLGKTIILANHDIAQSLRLSQQAVVLRQGRIVLDQPSRGVAAADVLAEMERP